MSRIIYAGQEIVREKKLVKNTISSLLFQMATIVCGFILPRLILRQFGSQVNGLINSITQFLQIIAFLELGVGAVVQSSLYRPLSLNDNVQVSCIIVSADHFFKKLAQILVLYVTALVAIYPFIVSSEFGWLYTVTLIVAISISFFSQYYFGVVDRLLLTADQRGYIQYNAQTFTLVLNTVVCVIFIKVGTSIQFLKLTTSLIYLLRPVFLRFYVNKRYQIDRKIKYDEEPIKQKWNGVAQHIAAIVLDQTDNIVLTMFDSLSSVSIYSVYFLVVNGVKQLFMSMTNGVQALIGEMWAKQEIEQLIEIFSWVEWIIHTGTTFVFGCTAILVLPFVEVYTSGISDADYIQPVFALLIVLANAMHCLRLPYNIMILAGGHYKQTQHNYIIAAGINIAISVLMVRKVGLIGVAIGTMIAMLYQTVWMAWYDSKNFIRWSLINFFKQFAIDSLIFILAYFLCKLFAIDEISYIDWIFLACKVSATVFCIEVFVNLIFYRTKCVCLFCKVRHVVKRSKSTGGEI